MDLHQDKLSKHDNNFEKTKFKNFSGLDIPETFMNIILCHIFSNFLISTVILTCRSSLAPYYISKGFFVLKQKRVVLIILQSV